MEAATNARTAAAHRVAVKQKTIFRSQRRALKLAPFLFVKSTAEGYLLRFEQKNGGPPRTPLCFCSSPLNQPRRVEASPPRDSETAAYGKCTPDATHRNIGWTDVVLCLQDLSHKHLGLDGDFCTVNTVSGRYAIVSMYFGIRRKLTCRTDRRPESGSKRFRPVRHVLLLFRLDHHAGERLCARISENNPT